MTADMTSRPVIAADPQRIERAMYAALDDVISDGMRAGMWVLVAHRDYVRREDLHGPTLTWGPSLCGDGQPRAVPDFGALRSLVQRAEGPVLTPAARLMVRVACSFAGRGSVELGTVASVCRMDDILASIVSRAVQVASGHVDVRDVWTWES